MKAYLDVSVLTKLGRVADKIDKHTPQAGLVNEDVPILEIYDQTETCRSKVTHREWLNLYNGLYFDAEFGGRRNRSDGCVYVTNLLSLIVTPLGSSEPAADHRLLDELSQIHTMRRR